MPKTARQKAVERRVVLPADYLVPVFWIVPEKTSL
jgi:hypothetical protein